MAFVLRSPPLPQIVFPSNFPKPIALLPLTGAPTLVTSHRPQPLYLAAVSPASNIADEIDEKPESASLPTSIPKDPESLSGHDLEECVRLLKRAAKTRKVPALDVLSALSAIKKAMVDPSSFLETLGGSKPPGRTWMLIFTAQSRLDKGFYFPFTAVQRFDSTAKRIENGIYVGPFGSLTFEGEFSWRKKKMLVFMFEKLRIKIGPFGPFKISLGKQERELNYKDPFFTWFYVDEEIAVAQGRSGGFAFWCSCHHVIES